MFARLRLPTANYASILIRTQSAHHRNARIGLHAYHASYTQGRSYATPPPQLSVSSLSAEQYEKLSDATMEYLLESLEELVDDVVGEGYEVEYSSGVLTLRLGDNGTYVINKQPPNKQIWLSSPFSGPKRYDYSIQNNAWYYTRDERNLDDLLNEELSLALKRPVKVKLGDS